MFETHVLLRLVGDGSSLVEHAQELLAQSSHAPALHSSHLGAELALEKILEGNDLDEMGPR